MNKSLQPLVGNFKSFSLLTVLILFLSVPNATGMTKGTSAKTDIVVIVMLDGARRSLVYEDVESAAKPFIRSLISEGAALAGEAVYPTNTMTNFVSVVTGSYPQTTGVVAGWSYFDSSFKEIGLQRQHVAVPSIFSVLEEHGFRGAFITLKGYDETGVGNATKDIVVNGKSLAKGDEKTDYGNKYKPTLEGYDQGFSYGWQSDDKTATGAAEVAYANKLRMTQIAIREGLRVLRDYEGDDLRLVVANFGTVDLAGHTWGPNHANYDRAIVDMDVGLQFFATQLQEIFAGRRLTFIVSADHGFTDSPQQIKSLDYKSGRSPVFDELFVGIRFGVADCGSSCVGFFIANPEQYREAFERLKAIKSAPEGWVEKIYTYLDYQDADGSLQELRTYFRGRTPQFYVDMRKNWSLTGPYGHGRADADNVNIPLILSGPGIKSLGKVGTAASIVDIAPTALSLLGIASPPQWGWSSNC